MCSLWQIQFLRFYFPKVATFMRGMQESYKLSQSNIFIY